MVLPADGQLVGQILESIEHSLLANNRRHLLLQVGIERGRQECRCARGGVELDPAAVEIGGCAGLGKVQRRHLEGIRGANLKAISEISSRERERRANRYNESLAIKRGE